MGLGRRNLHWLGLMTAITLLLFFQTPNVYGQVDAGAISGTVTDTSGAVVHLVERNAKKAAFLREALRVAGARGVVHAKRIEDIVDSLAGPIDCVTARALAPLHQLIGFAEPLVKKGAKALFPKGQDVEAELTEATKYWNIKPNLHASLTGGQGWIVELDHIERR